MFDPNIAVPSPVFIYFALRSQGLAQIWAPSRIHLLVTHFIPSIVGQAPCIVNLFLLPSEPRLCQNTTLPWTQHLSFYRKNVITHFLWSGSHTQERKGCESSCKKTNNNKWLSDGCWYMADGHYLLHHWGKPSPWLFYSPPRFLKNNIERVFWKLEIL